MVLIEIGDNLKKTIRNIAILLLIGWLAYVFNDELLILIGFFILVLFSGKSE